MKHNNLLGIMGIVVGLMSVLISCRMVEPLYTPSVVFPEGSNYKDQEIADALKYAATRHRWTIVENKKNLMVLEYSSAGNYVKVKIPYSTKGYKILYVDSKNLGYKEEGNLIGEIYNRWVLELDKDAYNVITKKIPISSSGKITGKTDPTETKFLSGKTYPNSQVIDAIEQAAKRCRWSVVSKDVSSVLLEMKHRQQTLKVKVSVNKTGYRIEYNSSVNMDYDPSTKSIIPEYNKWVSKLDKTITKFLQRR